MKTMFTNEFWIRIIIDVVLIGFISVGFGSWLNFKYTKKLKDYEPLTSEQILKKENYLNSKRDVFFEAIGIINRMEASIKWEGQNIPKNRVVQCSPPSKSEINACYSRLNLYVDNKEIIEKYPQLFSGVLSPAEIGIFVDLLRKDLGYDNLKKE